MFNTKKDALEFFSLMKSGDSWDASYHLSTAMCPHHRKAAIQQITADLKAKRKILVVSTQLIEAGVDFDFPLVFRALAPLEAIIQSAGRCNREGLLNQQGRLGTVYLFLPEGARYTNRKNFGGDTAMVFWTRNNQALEEIDLLDTPSSDAVASMIESLSAGNATSHRYLEPERFYSCTLSGAAARIAVRDWIETSLGEFRSSIALWFKDIAIGRYDADLKMIKTNYAPLYALARSCQRQRMKSDGTYEYDKDDAASARVAVALWKAALHKASIPVWVLSKALQRARYDVSAERAALIKLILLRNNKGGGSMIMESDTQRVKPVAYVCGQIFAKLEHIQYKALGDRNAGIREKYFTYAMTTPAAAFGRLFNLNSKHLTKLKSEQPGTAVNLDKELQELCREIDILKFPHQFLLEEQGQFAIGYYHQKQAQFAGSNNK